MADPVTIGLGAMAVGGLISAGSGYASDMAQADASRKNAEFYKTQAGYNQQATEREVNVFEMQTEDLLSRQSSAYAKSGVDLSGSPLLLITQTRRQANDQIAAIREKGRQATEISLLRAQDAANQADDIESGAFWKAAGSLFSTGGSMLARAPAKSGSTTKYPSVWSDTGSGTFTSKGVPTSVGESTGMVKY